MNTPTKGVSFCAKTFLGQFLYSNSLDMDAETTASDPSSHQQNTLDRRCARNGVKTGYCERAFATNWDLAAN